MKLSIIITYHDEGSLFLEETIDQIRNTIDFQDYEIIVVDDYSAIPLSDCAGIRVVRHNENMGVGAAFDTGVQYANSENILLMGCDLRFIKNGWSTMLIDEIEKHRNAFTCTSCVALKEGEMDIEKRRNVNTCIGATIIIFHDQKSNPTKSSTFRGLLEAKWLPKTLNRDVDSYEIPCILGAAYGVKKSWYLYCDGFALHKKWGTLEPYISLKSWMFGGSCRVAPRIEIGHIFKSHGTHGISQHILIYNKMMVSRLLFDDYERLFSFLGMNSIVKRGREIYIENLPFIHKKLLEYKSKIVYPAKSFIQRFDIDYRL